MNIKFSLRQLQVFQATADLGTISAAASALSMSQSAASNALKELESNYSMQLFDRRGKRLVLNGTGKELLIHVRAITERAEELNKQLLKQGGDSLLCIGATMTIANSLALAVIERYKQENPHNKITLFTANTRQIEQHIKNFNIDIGLIEGKIFDRDIITQYWQRDELVIFCHKDHHLASKSTLTHKDLLSAKWILREKGSGTRQIFDRGFASLLSQLDIEFELQLPSLIKQAVMHNLGVSCLSRLSIEQEVQNNTFKILSPTPALELNRELSIIRHRDKYQSQAMLQFLSMLLQS